MSSDRDSGCDETAVSTSQPTLSENKYRALFESTPVSLWEEDFSKVKQFIDRLQEQGITDFRAHFDAHPQDVLDCLGLVTVHDMNQATVRLYKAPNKEALRYSLSETLKEEVFSLFKEELILIGQNKTTFETEGINYTLTGERLHVSLSWSVVEGFEDTFSHVIVSVLDITEQKQAQELLKLQATALESAANAIVITNKNGNIVWANNAFTTLTGYTVAEAIGQNPRILKSGKNAESLYKELWYTILAGNVWHCEELINRRKDGTLYYEKMTVTPVTDAGGNIMQFIAVKEDISERKRLEIQSRRQLKEEELLRQIVSINPNVSQLSEALQEVCEKLGIYYAVAKVSFAVADKSVMLVDLLAEYKAPDASEFLTSLANILPIEKLIQQQSIAFVPNVQRAVSFKSVWDILHVFDNHAALMVPVEVSDLLQGFLLFDSDRPIMFNEDDIQFIAQVASHLSQMLQRVQAEEALQQQRDFAHQIMNNMGQGLFVLNASGVIAFCNPAFAQLLGYPEVWLIGRLIMDLGQFEMNKRVHEIDFMRADGSLINVLVTAVPHENRYGSESICVVTDLSAQKKIENTLAQARDQALEATRLKSEFLANMSHEIRTPLNAIIGMTSLMFDSSLNAEQQDYMQTIYSSGELLLALISDILDFSKIEAGKLELEERPFYLRSCLEEAICIVSNQASAKGLAMSYVIDQQVPSYIIGDIGRLRQVLVNLLSNALKFTNDGEVLLTVTNGQQRQGMPNSQMIQFSVKDTGIGVSPEQVDRLFKSFSQVDASTTRKYGGTGLGLAISKQLVEMMGGKIWVESEFGQGSTFFFTITAEAAKGGQERSLANNATCVQTAMLAPPTAVSPPLNTSLGQTHPLRILIVEDNRVNQKVALRILARLGYEADIANNGQEALDALRERPYDVIFMDVQMPVMDGVTATQEIRQQWPPNKQPSIVAMTAHALTGDREKYLQLGMDEYISKPIRVQALQTLLAEIVPNSHCT